MTGPAVTAPPAAGSANASGATEFERDIGEFFGDFSTSGESPEPDSTSAAGTTLAEPAAGTASETTDTPTAPTDAGEPAAGTTPVTPVPAAEDDPFKDTTPATFMVNGQPRTTEDIRVFKEGGAVIRPEALQNVMSKLSEHASLQERNHRQSQEYQTLAKVIEWHDQATNKTFSGVEAAIEGRISSAALFAENQLLVESVIKCPDLHAAGLLTTKVLPDGKGGTYEAVVFRPDAIASLQTQNELRQLKATQAIRDHFKTVVAESAKPQPAPIDFDAEGPKLVAEVAKASNLDASVLTPADRSLLAKQLRFHIRDGLASVEWQELVKDRIQLRTEHKASSATLVSTTEKATKEGQARMAAAARGVKPAIKPATSVRQPSPAQERAANEGDIFDALQSSAARAMRSTA